MYLLDPADGSTLLQPAGKKPQPHNLHTIALPAATPRTQAPGQVTVSRFWHQGSSRKCLFLGMAAVAKEKSSAESIYTQHIAVPHVQWLSQPA